jgi:hypothetical protein
VQLLLLSLRSMLMLLLLLRVRLLLGEMLSSLSTLLLKEVLDMKRSKQGLEAKAVCLLSILVLSCCLQSIWQVCLLLLHCRVVVCIAAAGPEGFRLLRLIESMKLRNSGVLNSSSSES